MGSRQHNAQFHKSKTLDNKYMLGDEIGKGAYGRVYKGLDLDNGDFVAVKQISLENIPQEDLNIIMQEIDLLKNLNHKNIVKYLGSLTTKSHLHIILEYVENGSLANIIKPNKFGPFSESLVAVYIAQVLEGLVYLHEQGVIHRDIKGANILTTKEGLVKLADFGVATKLTEADINTHSVVGTPYWMAPEVIEMSGVCAASDIWSVGCTVIELLTCAPPYYDLQPMPALFRIVQDVHPPIPEGLSPEITDFLRQCFQKDAMQRPDAKALLMHPWLQNTRPPSLRQPTPLRNIGGDDEGSRGDNSSGFCNTPGDTQTTVASNVDQHMGTDSQSAILSWSCVGDCRMDDMYIELDALECAVDGSKKPCNLKFSFLQFITKQFSDELKIGHGGCGLVYKGILPNRVIAVKKLLNNHTIDDKMFHQEVTSLMMVAHKNTVRLLGHCSHTEEKAIDLAGKIIMAEIRERLLCFEYVTNGSLENHITDELRGLEWYTRYQIIKGICEGLHHLHKEKHIIHLDLKPANILLDADMVPKISDFGLSRLDEKSHTLSAERLLTLGYCAPEYLQHGKRSAKSDIYSLGVIITELVTGSRGDPCITKVLRRWKHRWNKSAIDTQLWFKQVSTSLDLALRCKHTDPTDRPNISDIITDLNKMDNADAHINNDTEECLKLENMLDIEPLEMHFPFELNKHILGSIELTNDTDDYFAFRMSSISVRPYVIHPFKGIVSPRSKCNVTIMLQSQERVPPQFPCKDEFSVQSTRVDMNLTALDITEDMFHEELGKLVDEVTLTAVLYSPPPPDNIRADSIGRQRIYSPNQFSFLEIT